MTRALFFISASSSIGYVLYMYFYWKYMHCTVDFQDGMIDAPHFLLILMIVGLILSFF